MQITNLRKTILAPFSLAWLGGFFDGEGSVSLAYTTNGNKTGTRVYRLQTTLAQKNVLILRAVRKRFGGCLFLHEHTAQLVWGCRQGEAFLRTIQPYTILKRRVIDLVLEARDIQNSRATSRGGNRKMLRKISFKLARIRKEIMRLNKKD